MRDTGWLIGIGSCLSLIGTTFAAIPPNPILDSLTTTGVVLSNGSSVTLPAPSLPSGLDRQAQEQIVTKIAGKHDFAYYTRDSRVAPHTLKIKSIKDESGGRTGQSIDLWFVAYGDRGAIEEEELFEDLGGANDRNEGNGDLGESRELTADELAQRGISLDLQGENSTENYGHFDSPLLDKVRVSGVTRSVVTRDQDATLAAGILDTRFEDDDQFPNQWRSMSRNDLGEQVLGPVHTYSGFGAYVKVSELASPSGALLVEMHAVFDEPEGWFDGANLLRSKLPTVIQENVRRFRRKLKTASQQ